MAKYVVIFPGVGYTKDRPLLYFASRIAVKYGYEPVFLDFSGINWSKEKLKDSRFLMDTLQICLGRTEAALAGKDIQPEDEVLFISKSIGTVVATAFADKTGIDARQICFTPLVYIENYVKEQNGLIFYGSADPYADPGEISTICDKKKLEVYLIEDADHSLETGDVKKDIDNLAFIMSKVEERIKRLGL